jgi:hypothetical protein
MTGNGKQVSSVTPAALPEVKKHPETRPSLNSGFVSPLPVLLKAKQASPFLQG